MDIRNPGRTVSKRDRNIGFSQGAQAVLAMFFPRASLSLQPRSNALLRKHQVDKDSPSPSPGLRLFDATWSWVVPPSFCSSNSTQHIEGHRNSSQNAGRRRPPSRPSPREHSRLDDRSGLAIFCVVFCLTIATIMVGLRIWTRKVVIDKMGVDDWAAMITLVLTWVEGIAIAESTRYGLGKHIFAVNPPTLLMEYWKWFWVSLVFYCAGLFAAKMTFLLQYYRILAVQRMRRVYIIAIVLIGAWAFAQVLIMLLICRPIQGLWDKSVPADCMPNKPQIYVNAGGNIITDIIIFLLPMPAIKQLNLKKSQKILLFGIFSLGFFTVAISIIRIKFLDIGDSVRGDVTWQHVESSGWSLGELASALTCSSLPTLRPFIAKYFPSFGMTLTGDKPSYNQFGSPVGGSGGDPESEGVSRNLRTKKSGTTRASADSSGDILDHELRAFESKPSSTHDNNPGAFEHRPSTHDNNHSAFDHSHSTYDHNWK